VYFIYTTPHKKSRHVLCILQFNEYIKHRFRDGFNGRPLVQWPTGPLALEAPELRPRPRWGSLQRSPRPLSWIKGVLLLRGSEGKGKEGEGRAGEGRKGKEGKRRGEEGRGEEGEREKEGEGREERRPFR